MIGHARVEAAQALEHYGLKADWQTLGEYFARLERQGIGINLASYVGATPVREVVIGGGDPPPPPPEPRRKQATVGAATAQGAGSGRDSAEAQTAPHTAARGPTTLATRTP